MRLFTKGASPRGLLVVLSLFFFLLPPWPDDLVGIEGGTAYAAAVPLSNFLNSSRSVARAAASSDETRFFLTSSDKA